MKTIVSHLPFERRVSDQIYNVAETARHHEALSRARADSAAGWARMRDAVAARDAAAAIRVADLRQLDSLLEEFCSRFEVAGGVVHWAPDRADAHEALAQILTGAGVKNAVRGHSATLDELGFDEVYARAGATVRRSAFGDIINELSGDPASHPVYVSSHYAKEAVASILNKKAGEPLVKSPEEMADIVRRRLRPAFVEADAAILGANFLLAESGHIVFAENEGNLRLGAALPKTVVIVAGIDKVTARAENLPVLLATLAAASSGRPLPPSVTLLRPDAKREPARKIHLILVDHGRTRRLANPAKSETLRCIGCGACADVCPVYRLAGGVAFGMRAPGPYGLATELDGHESHHRRQLAMATPLCGACTTVCPVRIDLHDALVAARAEPGRPLPGLRLRLMLAAYVWSARSPGRFALGTALFKKLIVALDFIRDTPVNPVEAWSKYRTLPPSPQRSFRDWWSDTGGILPRETPAETVAPAATPVEPSPAPSSETRSPIKPPVKPPVKPVKLPPS